MSEIDYNEDPELLEDNEEGTGDESAYTEIELPEYDASQFELPDDYEDGDDEDE